MAGLASTPDLPGKLVGNTSIPLPGEKDIVRPFRRAGEVQEFVSDGHKQAHMHSDTLRTCPGGIYFCTTNECRHSTRTYAYGGPIAFCTSSTCVVGMVVVFHV